MRDASFLRTVEVCLLTIRLFTYDGGTGSRNDHAQFFFVDDLLLTYEIKAQKFRGKIRSIFREKFVPPKKIIRANFVLQTCHPKTFTDFEAYEP